MFKTLEVMTSILFLGLTTALLTKLLIGVVGAAVGFGVNRAVNKYGNLSKADQQAAALTLENQQILNQQEYDRKIDFYERFESPEAMVRQYSNAGLNPMLLAGGGASVSATGGIGSAGSAAAGSSSSSSGAQSAGALGDVLNSLLQFKLGTEQVANQKRNLSIQEFNSQTERIRAQADADYKRSLLTGQGITNKWLDTLYGSQLSLTSAKERNYDSMSEMNAEHKRVFKELCESEQVRRDLMRSDIQLKDAQKASEQWHAAILAAQAKHSGEYFKALADLQSTNALLASGEYGIFQHSLEKRKEAAIAELSRVITEAGMQDEIFHGDAFKMHAAGKLTSGERFNTWMSFGKSVIGAGIAGASMYGSAALKAAATKAVAPFPVFPGTMPQQPTYNPYIM